VEEAEVLVLGVSGIMKAAILTADQQWELFGKLMNTDPDERAEGFRVAVSRVSVRVTELEAILQDLWDFGCAGPESTDSYDCWKGSLHDRMKELGWDGEDQESC
jgi:hypothetical protein